METYFNRIEQMDTHVPSMFFHVFHVFPVFPVFLFFLFSPFHYVHVGLSGGAYHIYIYIYKHPFSSKHPVIAKSRCHGISIKSFRTHELSLKYVWI